MFRKLFLVILLSIVATAQAHAQSGSEACPTAPRDLLAGLDGTWSVQQGAGVMIVPVMGAMPLPPHEPLRLTMAYDPETGTSQLTGNGPDEQLIMFPTHESLVPQIQELVSEADKEDLLNIGEGCNWYALPLMVGTDTYSLDAPASSDGTTVIALALPDELSKSMPVRRSTMVCFTSREKQAIGDFISDNATADYVVNTIIPAMEKAGKLYVMDDFIPCTPPGTGDMTMTLLVKFQSPNSGTGMLIFEVNQNGTRAIAKAPVTMSR